MAGDRQYCTGCRDDYYNSQNAANGGCWSLKHAKVVTRYRIGWWTEPTKPGAFTKVKTNSCHYATGRYAHYEKLPSFAVSLHRKSRQAEE